MAPDKKPDVARRLGLPIDSSARQQSLHFGSGEHLSSVVRVVERLDSERVAGEGQLFTATIPQGKCEHPAKVGEHFIAAILV
jgi:hypothetical protein